MVNVCKITVLRTPDPCKSCQVIFGITSLLLDNMAESESGSGINQS